MLTYFDNNVSYVMSNVLLFRKIGLGYALIPKLANYVLISYNWQCVNAFFALLCFISSVFGILLQPISSCKSAEKEVNHIGIIIDDGDNNKDNKSIDEQAWINKPTLNCSQFLNVKNKGGDGNFQETANGINTQSDMEHSKSTNEISLTSCNVASGDNRINNLKNASFCLTGVSQDWYSKTLNNSLKATKSSNSKSLTLCHISALNDDTFHNVSTTKDDVNLHASSLLIVDLGPKEKKGCGISFNRLTSIKNPLNSSLCWDLNFIALSISNILVFMGLGIPFAFGPDMMVQKNIMSEENGSDIITPIGLTSMIIMPVIGLLIDNGPKLNPMGVTGFSLMSAGLSMISFVYCQTELVAIILATWFGVSFSTILSLPPVILERLIGAEKMKSALSILVLIRGISISVGGPIAGTIYDYTGEYDGTFYFAGALFLAGSIPMLMIYLKRRNKYI